MLTILSYTWRDGASPGRLRVSADGTPPDVQEGQWHVMTSPDSKICGPGTVPEWARESIARIAREYPENLAFAMDHVAEIEGAKRYLAEDPPARPAPPQDPREFLHLLVVEAWRSLASGQPVPSVGPVALEQGLRRVRQQPYRPPDTTPSPAGTPRPAGSCPTSRAPRPAAGATDGRRHGTAAQRLEPRTVSGARVELGTLHRDAGLSLARV
jgi:hypothetical protein